MAGVAVAVAQFAPTADAHANLELIDGLVARARARGARLVLFPEYSSYFVDPSTSRSRSNAEDIDGAFVAGLTALAARHGVHIVAGLLERGADGERVRNTVVAVDGSGLLAHYRKLHLYDAFGQRESDWVEAGPVEEPQTFEVDGLTFGLMTCYDLRFPEVARLLADAGVDVALVPAEWVRGPLKEHHWRTLLHARAIENTMYVAAADHPAAPRDRALDGRRPAGRGDRGDRHDDRRRRRPRRARRHRERAAGQSRAAAAPVRRRAALTRREAPQAR